MIQFFFILVAVVFGAAYVVAAQTNPLFVVGMLVALWLSWKASDLRRR